MTKELYDLLGVPRTASQDEIRRAYRALAKKYHPDLNPDDKSAEDKFKAVTAAYDLLSDEEMRGRYDRGEVDAAGQPRREAQYEWANSRTGGTGGQSEMDDLGDIFNEFFGGYRQARQRSGEGGQRRTSRFAVKGADIQYTMEIDFLEAALGASKRVTMHDGRTLDLTIPKGLKDAQTLRLKGKGMAGAMGGEAGDALVVVTVRPHTQFERDGNNIRVDLPISLSEAIAGGRVEVPTIHGVVTATIPKGSSTGRTLRLKGKGISGGDQFVSLKIVLPKTIDRELESFIERWNFADYNPRKD